MHLEMSSAACKCLPQRQNFSIQTNGMYPDQTALKRSLIWIPPFCYKDILKGRTDDIFSRD